VKPRVALYLCSCGENVSERISFADLADRLASLEEVASLRIHSLLCSEEGRAFLSRDLERDKPDRVVIAACTPREHEKTFRNVLEKSGLNPYLFQMVNLREQVAWVIEDKDDALALAERYIRAAVKRVALHDALERQEISCNTNVVVIGAGVAGMAAALVLARAGREVTLVEQNPFIGGKVVLYDKVFPTMECSSCMLEPMMDEILHHGHIEVVTCGRIREVAGFIGNFTVRIETDARFVDREKCVGCGECIGKCPVTTKNAFDCHLSDRKAIDFPFQGALPNMPFIDREQCLRFRGRDCTICRDACRFDAIDYSASDAVLERNAGGVVVATGFEVWDPSPLAEFGYGRVPDVYTSLEFERILSPNGPSGGKLVTNKGDEPKSLAIVHCVGSRSPMLHNYCSGVCCRYAGKFARLVRERLPDANVYDICADWCVPGKENHSFPDSARASRKFSVVRTTLPMDVKITRVKKGIRLSCKEVSGARRVVVVDMVVLCPAMIPSKTSGKLAEILLIPCNPSGFFAEGHAIVDSVSSPREGIFLAGCASGPKDIRSSIEQGAAAAAKLLSILQPGKRLELNAMTALVDPALCSGCRVCVGLCPYGAIIFEGSRGRALANAALCEGCGTCAAGCPSGAIAQKHFTSDQIAAEIEEVLR